jgi:tetratricopeptide (TPR) repeat protein
MAFADDDPRRTEFAARIAELQSSLAGGTPTTARHFVYHDIIEGLYRLNDLEGMIRYCYRELDEWPALGNELRKSDPERRLPPVIACRDRLLAALLNHEDFDRADRLALLLAERRVVDEVEDADAIRENVAIERLESRLLHAINCGEFETADKTLGVLLQQTPDSSPETLKWYGNRCLESGDDRRALAAFQSAIDADPLLPGVKDKLQRLGRKLGVQVGADLGRVRAELELRVAGSSGWEEKRDLAWKFTEVGLDDRAWGLLNETLLDCGKQRGSQETVYLMMARVLEKEKRYEHAILHCALALQARARGSMEEPSPRTLHVLIRCLKSGRYQVTSDEVQRIACVGDFDEMRNSLLELLRHGWGAQRDDSAVPHRRRLPKGTP